MTGKQPESKRAAERVHLGQVTGEVTVFQPLTILDLSESGALVETAFPLHLDSLHDFRLSLGDRSIVVKGRIVRCHIGELAEGQVRYRTGVEFVEPAERIRAVILDFIAAQKAAQTRPPIIDAEIAD